MSGTPVEGTVPGAEGGAAGSSAASNGFQFLVKNPTDRPGSSPFTVQVERSATVFRLKQLLAELYPGSPPVSGQRLIYAGKLLDNGSTIADVMGSADPSAQHTIHLVVSNSNRTGDNASSSTSAQQSGAPTSTNNATNGEAPPHQQFAHPINPGNMFPTFIQYPQYPYMYPGMQPMPTNGLHPFQVQFAPQFPVPPPPSDNTAPGQHVNGGAVPPAFGNMAGYATHLQQVERVIADSLAAAHNAAQEAENNFNAARDQAAQARDAQMRAGQAAAAQAAAAVASLHAQAHAHAMGNYDAGGHGQADNNAQQGGGGAPQRHVGFGFAIGRGNVPPPPPPPPHPHHHHHQNAAAGDGAPRVRQFVFQFEINWSLISKLIFIVYLLGQEGTPMRVYSLMLAAGIIYLWRMNRLSFLRRVANAAIPNPARLIDALFPREDQGNESERAAEASNGDIRNMPRQANRFGRGAVLLSFVYSFVYGFVCSLLPAWRPEPLPRIDELLNRNEEVRNGPQNDNENQEGNHEHAD